jgi:hypothetical protein
MMEHATQFPEEYSKVSSVQKKVRQAQHLNAGLDMLAGRVAARQAAVQLSCRAKAVMTCMLQPHQQL